MILEFTSLTSFTKIFIETLNKYAPIKKKQIRANHANFVTKGFRKAIMLRSRLRSIFLKKKKSLESKKASNKQRNICVGLVKRGKKEQFQLTYLKRTTRQQEVLENCKPPFLATKYKSIINLIEKIFFVTLDVEIVKTFKEYFHEIMPKLNIIQNKCYIRKTRNMEDPEKSII